MLSPIYNDANKFCRFALIIFFLSIPAFTTNALETDNQTLIEDLKALSSEQMQGRKMATQGAKLAAQYIALRFEELQLAQFKQVYIHDFKRTAGFTEVQGENVIAWLPGSHYVDRYIVITAHYDHLGTKGGKIYYGADDNASGVAAMIALAQQLKHHPARYSYIFVATDGEETHLHGAKAFLAASPVPLEQIILNINLDMIGQDKGNAALYIDGIKRLKKLRPVIDHVRSTSLLNILYTNKRPTKDQQKINWLTASDHYAFYQQRIPYLYFGVATHRYYHTPKDTWQNMNFRFYQSVVSDLHQVIRAIDNSDFSTR